MLSLSAKLNKATTILSKRAVVGEPVYPSFNRCFVADHFWCARHAPGETTIPNPLVYHGQIGEQRKSFRVK